LRDDGQCARNDLGLNALPADLAAGPANVKYIFPDECTDGHTDCTIPIPIPLAGAEADELTQADAF
jgi:hypothetical protein